MSQLFIAIYRYFKVRRVLLYSILVGSIILMSIFALKVKFDEDVSNFFPDRKGDRKMAAVFKNLKVKDKIVVLFSAKDSLNADPDALIEASQEFVQKLSKSDSRKLVKSILSEVDEKGIARTSAFIFDNLPILMTDDEFAKLDSITTPEAIDHKVKASYNTLVSPVGIALKDILLKDPLGLSGSSFAGLQAFGGAASYNLYNGYIFSEDLSKLVIVIDPQFGTGSTGKNEKLVKAVEEFSKEVESIHKDISVESFGGPIVGVYNSRQIKEDTIITLTIAILIIIVFISLAFRSRWAMVLITIPVLFGALFALFCIYFITGSISAIAIGAGAAVFGIAMSYSIHVLSHRSHTESVEQVIDELAYPLTIGSFTTIGAFLGLLFTSSKLLQDFGLFAALSLVGTTIFCLVFLPHMLSEKREKPGKLLHWVERLNSYRYDRNKWIVGALVIVIGICSFFYNDVRFDSDMMHLNYEPSHLKITEQKINGVFNSKSNRVFFVSADCCPDSALASYNSVGDKLLALKSAGKVEEVITAKRYFISLEEQRKRIDRWNRFWTAERQAKVMKQIDISAQKLQFTPGAFNGFKDIISKKYTPHPFSIEELSHSPLFKEWVSSADSLNMLMTQVVVNPKYKEEVYGFFKKDTDLVIMDKAYFTQKMAVAVKDDFNLILYLSSLLIFGALLLSYGRLELALMSFIPMFLSWIIILGFMALLGIEFNIVNIILSTFIFGIGDDFAIFIMDGLQSEYKVGKKMLSSHKTAIFFSAFTTVVGMGALIFAQHPALKSISAISILGMAAVVIISYTVQPILFRIFISNPASKSGFPQTFSGILITIYTYTIFVVGCLVLQLYIALLLPIPVRKSLKKRWLHIAIYRATRFIAFAIFIFRKNRINEHNERFEKPAVVVANHQSFIDIIVLLGLNPKMLMVTNSWVWRSPFFGWIVRYADYYHADNGYEQLVDTFKAKVEEGYSIVIFPEGTRSTDGSIKRFHKGAFYLAEKLQLDILPVVIYGNGKAISKVQPFIVKPAAIATKILKRIPTGDTTYKDLSKKVRTLFVEELRCLSEELNSTSNPYFYASIIRSYLFKGPVLEWYMRIKIRMEERYKYFDKHIPKKAKIVDIGCGYGPLSYMLALTSPDREVLGIDYDEEKIATAQHSQIKVRNVKFECGNALTYELPTSDVFVLSDILHYLDNDSQHKLLVRCLERLENGGSIIVRDGDTKKQRSHRLTILTEKFSTKVFKFNKAEVELCFTSSEMMQAFAIEHGLSLQMESNDRYTSNTIYIFKRNG